eukprot:1953228-Pleurochrysis_carterae.AAC.2
MPIPVVTEHFEREQGTTALRKGVGAVVDSVARQRRRVDEVPSWRGGEGVVEGDAVRIEALRWRKAGPRLRRGALIETLFRHEHDVHLAEGTHGLNRRLEQQMADTREPAVAQLSRQRQ